VDYSGAKFIFGQGLFRRRCFICQIQDGRPFAVIVVFWQSFVCSPLAEQHQGVINGYTRYPG
jgi:hypothetical protein